jgi:hypothetical protein
LVVEQNPPEEHEALRNIIQKHHHCNLEVQTSEFCSFENNLAETRGRSPVKQFIFNPPSMIQFKSAAALGPWRGCGDVASPNPFRFGLFERAEDLDPLPPADS